MREIIFSKFSNERAEEFNIRTDIIIDDSGKKVVCKSACNEKGLLHLNNIYRYYLELSKMYANTNIQINKCVRNENTLEFEYIDGKTLEEELDQLLHNKNNKEFLALINKFTSYIKEGLITSKFIKTEQFKKVFGDIDLPGNIEAGSFNNIDTLFGNIIINDKWNVIDYEWSFNFPIPLNFIIYRSFFYYLKYSNRNELLKDNIYKMFGIDDKEIKIYETMEMNFQSYILGGSVPIRNLSNNNLKIREISNNQNIESNILNLSIQIFFDYGNGMNEENSYIINMPQFGEKKVNFNIDNLNNAIAIRIDPASEQCLISDFKIFDLARNRLIQYNTNGTLIQNNNILFCTKDPQIILDKVDSDVQNIAIEFHIDLITKSISDTLLNIYYETQGINLEKENMLYELDSINKDNIDLNCKIEDLEQKNLVLKNQLEEIQRIYNDIINSNCWKATKPIRSILGRLKKIL